MSKTPESHSNNKTQTPQKPFATIPFFPRPQQCQVQAEGPTRQKCNFPLPKWRARHRTDLTGALTPTRMIPVLVERPGRGIFEYFIRSYASAIWRKTAATRSLVEGCRIFLFLESHPKTGLAVLFNRIGKFLCELFLRDLISYFLGVSFLWYSFLLCSFLSTKFSSSFYSGMVLWLGWVLEWAVSYHEKEWLGNNKCLKMPFINIYLQAASNFLKL